MHETINSQCKFKNFRCLLTLACRPEFWRRCRKTDPVDSVAFNFLPPPHALSPRLRNVQIAQMIGQDRSRGWPIRPSRRTSASTNLRWYRSQWYHILIFLLPSGFYMYLILQLMYLHKCGGLQPPSRTLCLFTVACGKWTNSELERREAWFSRGVFCGDRSLHCRLQPPLKTGRKSLLRKDGGSVDANFDFSCNHPCCSL